MREGQRRGSAPEDARPLSRRLREDPLDAVYHVAETIGPRPATSLAEAQAAAYLDGRLRRAGLRVSADPFPAPASAGWDGPLAGLLLAAGVPLYYWAPLGALALALAGTALALWQVLRPDWPLLARRRESQNVIGTRAPPRRSRWRVVLLAPLDSAPRAPAPARWLLEGQRLALARLASSAAVVLAALAGLWDVQRLWWYLQMPPALLLLLLGGLGLWLLRAPATPGAVSHAGALGVLLSSAELLGPTERVELWAVGLGATASGRGLADLLRRYPFERETTLFVALEGIGAGELAYLTREGSLGELAADADLLRYVAAADADDPRIDAAPRPYRASTAAGRLLRQRRPALAITCLGPDGRVPLRFSPDDTPAAVDGALLERAVRLVVNLVRQIEQNVPE